MKKKTKIFACAMAGINIFLAVLCSGCVPSSQFTEEEHLSRLNDRVERKLSESEIEYTEFEIYPVYDENDKFGYVLVELEPKGYFYIEISAADTSLLGGARMYLVEYNAIDQEKWGIKLQSWTPCRIEDGVRKPFTDENGEPIQYFHSHFKVVGIEDERRYLLDAPKGLIPAVKRGEQYLDLMDGELIDYDPKVYSEYTTADIYFTVKSYFNL